MLMSLLEGDDENGSKLRARNQKQSISFLIVNLINLEITL